MKSPLYMALARTLAWEPNPNFEETKRDRLRMLKYLLPITMENACDIYYRNGVIIIETDYHHLNDGGYWDGWTNHTIRIKPSLEHGFVLTISGRNRKDIKEYLHDTWRQALEREVEY